MKVGLIAALIFGSAAALDELKIETTHAEECQRRSKSGDTISMHYSGRLASNDKEFDSSYKRDRPITFKLGTGRVIKGWDQGLLDLCPGDKRTLTIPAHLGYGDRGSPSGSIPPGATLIFDVECVEYEDAGVTYRKKDEL